MLTRSYLELVRTDDDIIQGNTAQKKRSTKGEQIYISMNKQITLASITDELNIVYDRILGSAKFTR